VELADTSAWSKARHAPADVRAEFDQLLLDDQVATCEQVVMELLVMVRGAAEFVQRRDDLATLPQCPITADVWKRAIEVFGLLADQGPLHHRQVKPADLIIAAAAERAGVGVLHYDQDFDVIAGVTGQETRWIAERGSL
jgi:predicted nucleic acid-binding protein